MSRLSPVQIDKSLVFSASSDRVDAGSDFIGTGDVTVCAWVKLRAFQPNNGRIIGNGKFIFKQTGSNAQLSCTSDGATNVATPVGSMKLNKWTPISITRTAAGRVNFRIDFVASGAINQNSGAPSAGTTNVFIGNDVAASTNWPGFITKLTVFNRILTAAEQDNVNMGIMPSDYATSKVRNFTFANDTSSTIYDNDDLTKTGAVTGAIFSQDTPSKPRDYPGKNLFVSKIGGVGSVGYPGISPVGTPLINSNNWVEDERFHIWGTNDVNSVTINIDSTDLYQGNSTVKILTTDATGRGRIIIGLGQSTSGSVPVAKLYPYGIICKPVKAYSFSILAKYSNLQTTSFSVQEYDSQGNRLVTNTSANFSGNSSGAYVPITIAFTTNLKTAFLVIAMGNNSAGNNQLINIALSSLSLVETTPARNTNVATRIANRDYVTGLQFPGGTTSGVTCLNVFTNPIATNGYSMSCWVKSPLVTDNTGSGSVFLMGNGSGFLGVGTSYLYLKLRGGLIHARCQVNGGSDVTTTAPQVPGKFVHIGASFNPDAARIRLYVNGLQRASAAGSGFGTLYTTALKIAGLQDASLNGIIDEPKVWNRVLADEEFAALAINLPVSRAALAGEWLFDESSGTTAIDTSGNGNDGIITNGTYINYVPNKARPNAN